MVQNDRSKNRTFESILNEIRSKSKNKSDLGTKFEILMKNFFLVDKHYKDRFETVYLWSEYPDNDGHDTGIDLVAKEQDGNLCAIQCKCYADDGSLDMQKVSTFLASSIKYKNRILVYTGENITNNAEKVLKKHNCKKIRKEDLEESSINWVNFPRLKTKTSLKLHAYQNNALNDVLLGFAKHDRGKLIMACGTGKTIVSLHIAEKLIGKSKIVLYLVPSISLIQQTMRAWSNNGNIKHRYMAVCSDGTVGEGGSITELESPATTDPHELRPYVNEKHGDAMTVIFSTYHSVGVVQKALSNKMIDLVICDEAHRTTGMEGSGYYTIIHDNANISAKKRLYMTATPKIYSETIKKNNEKIIYSMDDEEKFGPEFHKLNFTDAVHKFKALSDFRVKIAVIPDELLKKKYQINFATKDGMIPVNEKTRMAAIWHGLLYPDDDESNENLLQRVIVFFNRIDKSEMFAGDRSDPNNVMHSFVDIVEEYNKKVMKTSTKFTVDVKHIDGKDNAHFRRNRMKWLTKSNDEPFTCRLISNARCLSEGVDVPALDGVVFADPRQSVVDVVQSVGRVMRKFEGKKFGYVILPVAIPAGMAPHEAFNSNGPFKIVWQVLNGLRSHDENLAREINQLILDTTSNDPKEKKKNKTPRISISVLDNYWEDKDTLNNIMIDQIKTKLVEKVGDSYYYDKYGQHLGKVSKIVEKKMYANIENSSKYKSDLSKFHNELKQLVNSSVTEKDSIRIISQHIVLSQVFNQLFSNEFTSHNPISKVLDSVTKIFGMHEELEELEELGFYEDVKNEIKNITTRKSRQNFIKIIYSNFFKSVIKNETEKHGIVYTPVEIIDFIIHSIEHILKIKFNSKFDARSVKVLDPFAGTGTFITRLLESNLIKNNLYEKYKHDLFANELILLAYYVSTINIETTFSNLYDGKYTPFTGVNYTDTLMLNARYRDDERHRTETTTLDTIFKSAHDRVREQKMTNVHVIMGNPPYSAVQENFNDNNANIKYPDLDQRIRDTYSKEVNTTNKDRLYDSYIRSIRWASDRIGESGIIAFVTNSSFLRSNVGAGIRVCLTREFNNIWCYDLRGNARTQGDLRRSEGGNIFDSGSRTPVAIIILVKTSKNKQCTIQYKNIGDSIKREEKLKIIKNTKSIKNIKNWEIIKPDKHDDWLNQRNDKFENYIPIGDQNVRSNHEDYAIFKIYSGGVNTSRDVWVYNSSKNTLSKNMKHHIDYCNSQNLDNPKFNAKHAKWDGELSQKLKRLHKKPIFDTNKIRVALYRPFFKQFLYFDKIFNIRHYQISKFLPTENSKNIIICFSYKVPTNFTVFITNIIPDLNIMTANQCFPLYTYEMINDKYVRKDNITNSSLREFQTYYNDNTIKKLNIFYYVYGLLHHPQYRKKYGDNLMKELPRIPMADNFWAFCEIGKKLADIHINFENCDKYDITPTRILKSHFSKLSFPREKDPKTSKPIKNTSKILADNEIIFTNIPKINHKINGRTFVDWIVDRYQITVDGDSGIINDPCTNVDIVSLIQRAIYAGIESDRIISNLPSNFEPKNWKPSKKGLDIFQ